MKPDRPKMILIIKLNSYINLIIHFFIKKLLDYVYCHEFKLKKALGQAERLISFISLFFRRIIN